MEEQKENVIIEATTESRTEKVLQEYDKVYEEIEANGALGRTYDPEASLVISGKDFANMVNYCVSVENLIGSVRNFVISNKKALEMFESHLSEMELFNSSMGVSLLKQHNEYFKSGQTIGDEEADIIDAKQKVKKVDE